MHKSNPISPLILLTLITLTLGQQNNNNNYAFTVLPSASYININGSYLTEASPQACYADCQSCQILSNLCEQCYVPYFSKTPQGTCQLTTNYTLQSSNNELRSGAAFQLVAESWSNEQTVNCSARNNGKNFQSTLITIAPTPQTAPLIYNRTLSLHNYIVVRFQLITTNWNNNSQLNILLYNQANTQLTSPLTVNYLPNVPKESLCSNTNIDQRFSVTAKVQDNNTTSLSIQLAATKGLFYVSTWGLISGLCDPTCSSCSYSTQPTACLGCNYFLAQISDGSCSQCPSGFRLATSQSSNGQSYSYCQKCPIQYQTCTQSQSSCYYPQLNTTVANNCSLVYSNSFYSQIYEVNAQTFVGSLFTVNGLPSPSQYAACGSQTASSYTYIGPALPYQPVTRIFANLPYHLSLSLSFNVFVIDTTYQSRNTKFQIYLNNQLYDVKYLMLKGMSNLCAGEQLQSFTTFPPTDFYPNNQTDLNLTILADTQWGLRNLRIAFQKCDSNCLTCGAQGCQRCKGYLQLRDGLCQDCPPGFGKNTTATTDNFCFSCPQNCLNCTQLNGKTKCLLCSQPFFEFEGQCRKKTNIGNTLTPTTLSTQNLSTLNSNTCNLSLPTATSNNNTTNTAFTLSQSTLSTVIVIPQPHYRSIVEFYLMRIGLWNAEDRLDVYLNDLRVLSKTYPDYGNKFCSPNTTTETDYLSFESLDFTDSNSSLSIYFELVSASNTPRTYGVAHPRVYPVGCQSCLVYPFSYTIQYNYDEYLNVVVSFSRVYKNTNASLFKQIFILTLDGQQLPYELTSNNTVIYNLRAQPPQNTLNGKLLLQCLYPELVTTDIQNPVNSVQPFFSRRLQETNYAQSKIIDNTNSNTRVSRFTPVENPNAINGVRTFFQIITRIAIYVGFALFFVGLQTIGTHLMHNLQKLWLHIFLAALAAPALLRQTLTGFRQIQNQNIAVHPTQWQSQLPLEQYYNSRSYFYEYYTDVNFFRNIYNIAIAFGALLLYLLVMHFLSKKYITREMTENNNILRHWKITFHRRPYFYFNSIVFYQYLTLMLACMLQFTSLLNKTEQGAFTGISAAAAIVAFIIGTVYPLFHFLWLRHKQNSLGKLYHVQFANRYHEIFFRFVHRNIWADDQITYSERFYNLYRYGQIWWYCLVVTALAYNPQAQLYLLLITQALHLFLVLYTKLSRNLFFRMTKVLELAFFVGLQIIMLVCQSDEQTLTERSYNTLGGVAIGFIFAILLLSLTRSVYNAWLLYQQYQYKGMTDKVHARQGEVMRRDQYYDSDEELEEVGQNQKV